MDALRWLNNEIPVVYSLVLSDAQELMPRPVTAREEEKNHSIRFNAFFVWKVNK